MGTSISYSVTPCAECRDRYQEAADLFPPSYPYYATTEAMCEAENCDCSCHEVDADDFDQDFPDGKD